MTANNVSNMQIEFIYESDTTGYSIGIIDESTDSIRDRVHAL